MIPAVLVSLVLAILVVVVGLMLLESLETAASRLNAWWRNRRRE